MSVINPGREKSGTYKVILRNAQGQDERDINVNIMGEVSLKYFLHDQHSLTDKPTPPLSCKVTDVFHDNVVVNWTPPADDGGTDITRLMQIIHFILINISFL